MKLKSNLAYVYKVGKHFIMPGLNYIDDLAILEHPHLKHHVEKKTIELLSELKKDEANHIDYNAMNYKKLIREINDLYDIKLLEKIKRLDKRQSVINAVDNQIEKIKDDNED